MASTIQVRVDDDLKTKSDKLFKDLGTDTTTAIRMFLTQAVAHNGFPFEIKKNSTYYPYETLTEEQVLARLKRSRQQADEGNVKNADKMIADMREKYGL